MAHSDKHNRVAVYIDGGNFFRRLKDPEVAVGGEGIFNYSKLVDHLVNGRNLISKRYYVGIVRNLDNTPKSASMVKGQQKFLAEIENEGFSVQRGKIVYDHNIREKGVDVKIAIDLIIGAVDDLYDTAIVVSSDTDLVPAIQYIKNIKKKSVEYVGFSHKPSLGMQRYANLAVLLQKKDIETCFKLTKTTIPEFKPKLGQIDFTNVKRAPVLNCIVSHAGKILIVQRSANMNFHPGVWNGISGFLDEPSRSLEDKVKEELREEAGISEENIISLHEGSILEQEDVQYDKTWIVHPVLAEVKTDAVQLDWEAQKYAWIDPKEVWNYALLPGFDAVIKTFFPD